MDELRKEHRRQQTIHDRERRQQRNDLRDLQDELEDQHQQELQQLRDVHRQEKLDLQDEHRHDRQDLIDMYKTELQRQDAEIRRLKRQLLHQQQTPSQQLTRLQDEIKDLQDQVI